VKCPSCGLENIEERISGGNINCPNCGTEWRALARLMLLPRALFNEALTAAKIGDWPRAEELAITAVSLDTQLVPAWLLLGKVLAHLDGHVRAIAAWKKVIELEPENESARAAIAWARAVLRNESQGRIASQKASERKSAAATGKRQRRDKQ
jgi:tetratricopeptide (TPR) repeat protein